MPTKDKQSKGTKELARLQPLNTKFKHATLSTPEPKINDINTGSILRSELSSSETELLYECNNRIIDISNICKQFKIHTLCPKCCTPNMSIQDYKYVGIVHLLQLYCMNDDRHKYLH